MLSGLCLESLPRRPKVLLSDPGSERVRMSLLARQAGLVVAPLHSTLAAYRGPVGRLQLHKKQRLAAAVGSEVATSLNANGGGRAQTNGSKPPEQTDYARELVRNAQYAGACCILQGS